MAKREIDPASLRKDLAACEVLVRQALGLGPDGTITEAIAARDAAFWRKLADRIGRTPDA